MHSSSVDFVLTSPTPPLQDFPRRKTLLASLPLPDRAPTPDYFAFDDAMSDIKTPPIPPRRKPYPIVVPPLKPLPRPPAMIDSFPSPPSPPKSTPPPTPSSLAPVKMTGLLTEVLSIMNSIMSEQQTVQTEEDLLSDLTELVVIMQEEAEALLNLADLVEEFVEEVEVAAEVAEIEDWVEDLDLERVGTAGPISEDDEGFQKSSEYASPTKEKNGHGRDDSIDSAVWMNDEGDGYGNAGELRESLHQGVALALTKIERERGSLIEIGKRAIAREAGADKKTVVVPSRGFGSTKARKGGSLRRTEVHADFRDSGLDIKSPVKLTKQKKKKSRRWI